MSFVTIEEKPRPTVGLEAVLFATLGQRGDIVEWISERGDEDVIFRHKPALEDPYTDDESYILIAGDDMTARVFVGQWLVRYPGNEWHDNNYVVYDVDEFNARFNLVEED